MCHSFRKEIAENCRRSFAGSILLIRSLPSLPSTGATRISEFQHWTSQHVVKLNLFLPKEPQAAVPLLMRITGDDFLLSHNVTLCERAKRWRSIFQVCVCGSAQVHEHPSQTSLTRQRKRREEKHSWITITCKISCTPPGNEWHANPFCCSAGASRAWSPSLYASLSRFNTC